MLRLSILALCALAAGPAAAQGFNMHDGYVRRDGTYVPPHFQTNPDSNRFNNWSSQGNTNPFTGHAGTVSPYPQPYQPPQPSYSAPRSIYGR